MTKKELSELVHALYEGTRFDTDRQKSYSTEELALLQEGSEKGMGEAQYLLGMCHLWGHPAFPKEEWYLSYPLTEGWALVHEAAKNGCLDAKLEVANAHSVFTTEKFQKGVFDHALAENLYNEVFGSGDFVLMQSAQKRLQQLRKQETEFRTKKYLRAHRSGSTSELSAFKNAQCNYPLDFSSIRLNLSAVENHSPWQSGSVRIMVWLCDEPYEGGEMKGHFMGDVWVSTTIRANGSVSLLLPNVTCTGNPPTGSYQIALTLNELNKDDQWYIVDWCTMEKRISFVHRQNKSIVGKLFHRCKLDDELQGIKDAWYETGAMVDNSRKVQSRVL